MLVGQRIENIHILDSVLTSLFISIDEVNPMVDILGNISTFQSPSEFRHKSIRIFISPTRQNNIIDYYFVLGSAVLVVVLVDKHLGESIYFRN